MLEYKNEIRDFWDLKDLCWSGALDRLKEVEEIDAETEFFAYIVAQFDYLEEPPTLTEINDFIWFECDEYIEELKANKE